MLILISPSKNQDFDTPAPTADYTIPRHLGDSQALIDVLKHLSVSAISSLMDLSEKLSVLNHSRYQTWRQPFTPQNAKQAMFAFSGDVYDGLDAGSMRAEEIAYAQAHLRMLSGLYGTLRPLDLIQPYRLEMGIRLKTDKGADLYAYWGGRLTEMLNADLKANDESVVVNLASNEYFSAVQPKKLAGDLISPVFKDRSKSGELKIISIFAKRARGLMARWIVRNRIESAEELLNFDVDGYCYDPTQSKPGQPVFVR